MTETFPAVGIDGSRDVATVGQSRDELAPGTLAPPVVARSAARAFVAPAGD